MKRMLALILVLTLFASVTCLAAESKKGDPAEEETDQRLSYDTIGGLISKNNPQIKLLYISIQDMSNTIQSLKSSMDVFSALQAIDARISAINQAEIDAAASGNPLSAEQIAANRTAIAKLEAQKQALMSSQNQLRETTQTLEESLEVTRINLDATRQLLIYNGQALLSSYYKIENQLDELDNSMVSLTRQKNMMEAMVRAGQVTELEYNNLTFSVDSLKNTRASIERQKASLLKQINLLIGIDVDTIQEIAPFEAMLAKNSEGEQLSREDADAEYALALEANFSLKAEELTYQQKYKKNYSSAETRSQEVKLKNAKQNFELAFYNCFDSIFTQYDLLSQAHNTLLLKEQDLRVADVKYSLGQISKNDLEEAKSAVVAQKIKIQAAQIDYMNAYLKFQCFQNGGMPQ